jgi:hypothetical protein
MLDRNGRRNLYKMGQTRQHRYHYHDPIVKRVETYPVACWLIESPLGEQRLMVTDVAATMDLVVDIMRQWRWRAEFTVTRIDAGNFTIQPHAENRHLSGDARKVNQDLEVVV